MSKAKRGKSRNLYLGNNTPQGFFSYYEYILGQREADKIICIKGGPGTGKSTFMRKIGDELLIQGHDVDFMHCSADSESLDGIVIRDKKIALVDGTSPHIVDPINPGAVDSIIHLGDYWNREGIQSNKMAIIKKGEEISAIYKLAYNYFAGAGKVYNNIAQIKKKYTKEEEAYKKFAGLISDELAHKEIGVNQGSVKKYFATAITAGGYINYMDSIVSQCKNVYVVQTEFGVSISKMLELFAESAVLRGFVAEKYYCPMSPDTKLEHLVLPELGIAILTANKYHNFADSDEKKLNKIWFEYKADLSDILDYEEHVLKESEILYADLMLKGIECLKNSKKQHDNLETYYIPNMDFIRVEALRKKIVESIIQ